MPNITLPRFSQNQSPARWRLGVSGSEFLRSFEDCVVIFDSLTWETRILNDVGSRVVLALTETFLSMDELIARSDLDVSDLDDGGDALRSELSELLQSLAEAGLVERGS